MTQEAKTDENTASKAYKSLETDVFVFWPDLRMVILDMARRITELEAEVGSYRDKTNQGSDEGH